MAETWLKTYLDHLAHELRAQGVYDPRILEEAKDHLLEAMATGQQDGLSNEEAQRWSLERFGSPRLIARQFYRERSLTVQKILAVLALACGLAIAYVDTRPNWDDTGITVFALLVCCGLLGLLAPKRPWLWALLVGIWIPVFNIVATHNFGSVLALIFPFFGAYAGMLVGMLVRKALSLA